MLIVLQRGVVEREEAYLQRQVRRGLPQIPGARAALAVAQISSSSGLGEFGALLDEAEAASGLLPMN